MQDFEGVAVEDGDDGASEVGGFQGRAHRDTADENRALIKLVHFLFIDTRRGWHLEQTA